MLTHTKNLMKYLSMNPYGDVPVLVDRELTLYESNIINEFIDERFPHPQLMPTDPSLRAKARLLLFNFEREIFSYIDKLENEKDENLNQTRLAMKENCPTYSDNF